MSAAGVATQIHWVEQLQRRPLVIGQESICHAKSVHHEVKRAFLHTELHLHATQQQQQSVILQHLQQTEKDADGLILLFKKKKKIHVSKKSDNNVFVQFDFIFTCLHQK